MNEDDNEGAVGMAGLAIGAGGNYAIRNGATN